MLRSLFLNATQNTGGLNYYLAGCGDANLPLFEDSKPRFSCRFYVLTMLLSRLFKLRTLYLYRVIESGKGEGGCAVREDFAVIFVIHNDFHVNLALPQ